MRWWWCARSDSCISLGGVGCFSLWLRLWIDGPVTVIGLVLWTDLAVQLEKEIDLWVVGR